MPVIDLMYSDALAGAEVAGGNEHRSVAHLRRRAEVQKFAAIAAHRERRALSVCARNQGQKEEQRGGVLHQLSCSGTRLRGAVLTNECTGPVGCRCRERGIPLQL